MSESAKTAIGRRALLKGAAFVAAAGATSAMPAAEAAQDAGSNTPAPNASSRDIVSARGGESEVQIESGKIAGYVRNGIHTFKGVPYGDTTAGEHRFGPPRKPKPWAGVRSSRQYGYVSPQGERLSWANDEEAFMFQWNDGVQNEDCLRINVWTPAINDNKKRPVMVWLHGGGFAIGSGNELLPYDGENLARRGDVVVVTLNHRLNILGYMDLSKYGDRYAQSGNIGMLDIVLALEWVRDNIAVFGGDSQNVLIFGQSGGGMKVNTLMAMPTAKGLFHRAAIQSGSFRTGNINQEKTHRLTDLVLAELGLGSSTIDRLHTIPYTQLERAGAAALRKANPPPGKFIDVRATANNVGFSPVIDGKVLPTSFNTEAPAISADIPVIIGTTMNEFVTSVTDPQIHLMTEEKLMANTEAMFPGRSKNIVATFRRGSPQAKPFQLWSRIASSVVRQRAIEQATLKAAQNKAPAYLYWFAWQTPILDGRPMAFHCIEVPFVFDNTDRCDTMTGGGPEARALGAVVADAWIQFARTGKPDHKGMPAWSAFSPKTAATMVFDNDTKLILGPDAEEQASILGA